MALNSFRDGDVGIGVRIYGGVRDEEVEYGRAIHCNTIKYRHLQGDGMDVGGVGGKKLV